MAVNVKAFGMASALLGGCIGLPWYLIQRSKSSAVTAQISLQSPATTISSDLQEVKATEKVNCEISASSQISQNWEDVIKSRNKDLTLYSLVSCQNANVTGEYASLFGSNWMGLFPKNVLSETLSLKTQDKFEINIEATQEEGDGGSKMIVVFSNPETKSSVRSKLEDITNTNFSKKSVVVSIEGNKQTPKEIYLLVDSRDEAESNTVQ